MNAHDDLAAAVERGNRFEARIDFILKCAADGGADVTTLEHAWDWAMGERMTLQQQRDELVAERDILRGLWLEWLDGTYDGADLLRRVRIAVHGPGPRAAIAKATGSTA